MDPVDPFFDSRAWMEEYDAQRERAGQRAGNASRQGNFERQVERLNLDSSDEGSTKSESPDPTPAGGGRGIRREDFGGSMRMSPHSALMGGALGGTRRSVDVPRIQLEAPVQVPQFSLQDDLFSSARYSLPDWQPAIQAKSGKSRGIWSRIKSKVGEAFGGSSNRTSSKTAATDVLSTSFRVDYARQPGRTRGVSAADEALIQDFRHRAAGNLSDGTIRNAAADLRHLSERLSANGRPSIADRIRRELENAQLENPEVENRQLEAELDEDVDTYAKDRGRRIKAALKKVREVGAGNTLSADIRRLAPHRADAALIGMWAAAEKATHRVDPKTIDRQARRLSRLSDWLQSHHRQPLAGRLFTAGLTQDVEEYRHETEDGKINADLLRLGLYQQILEANRALGAHPPEDAGPPAGEGARLAASPQEPPSTPSGGAWDWLGEQIHGPASPVPAPRWAPQPDLPFGLPGTPAASSKGALDWLRQQMREPASPSLERPQSSNLYGSLEPLVDLDPPTPYDLRDDAGSAPAPEFGRAPLFAGPSGAAQELRDIGAIVGTDWRHGSQAASDVLIDVLGNINLLPNQFGPSQFTIDGERYSASLGEGGRRGVRLIHHPRMGQLNEAGPSQPLHQPPQMVGAGRPREAAVDLGYLIRGGWEHRERFLPPYLVRVLDGQGIMPEAGRPTYFDIRGVAYRGELVESEGRLRVRIYPEFG